MKKILSNEEMIPYAESLKASGFTVILRKEPVSWFFFFKDGGMGYVQKSSFSGYDYSQVVKPHEKWGQGFRIRELVSLQLHNAQAAVVKPVQPSFYGGGKKIKPMQFWESPEEFINAPLNKSAEFYIL